MQLVKIQGGAVAAQHFGSRGDPALLLIMGATASMLGWPDALCVSLADEGFFVIRFDHRDTGRSSAFPPGKATYAVEDMANDVLAVMDHYELKTAHLIGMSLGGYIAQMIALEHPGRVDSLILVSAEPLGWDGPELPHISQSILDHFSALSSLDWSDRSAVKEFLLEIDRLSAGTGRPFDEVGAGARIEQVLDRTNSPASMFNHSTLSVQKDWTGRFRAISCPVLVIHGADDPVLPIDNGRAIAEGINGAELMVLNGVGHEIPPDRAPEIVRGVARHINKSVGRSR